MRATDVMRTSFETVTPQTPVKDAVRLLLKTNQRGLPPACETHRFHFPLRRLRIT
jgi:CBS domain-containing protein